MCRVPPSHLVRPSLLRRTGLHREIGLRRFFAIAKVAGDARDDAHIVDNLFAVILRVTLGRALVNLEGERDKCEASKALAEVEDLGGSV